MKISRRHGTIAKDLMDEKASEEQEESGGVGGGNDPREDSVLLALPGFRFKVCDIHHLRKYIR